MVVFKKWLGGCRRNQTCNRHQYGDTNMLGTSVSDILLLPIESTLLFPYLSDWTSCFDMCQNNMFTLWSWLGCGNRGEGCPSGTLGQPKSWFAYFIIPFLVHPILRCDFLHRSPWRCLLPPAPNYFFSLIPILICVLPNFRFMILLSR